MLRGDETVFISSVRCTASVDLIVCWLGSHDESSELS